MTPPMPPADPAARAAVTVPLRPCLGVAAVILLALAMISTAPGGFVCGYTPLAVTEVGAAFLLALAACTVPRRAWQFPPVVGRAAIIGACLFLAARVAYRVLEPAEGPLNWTHAFVALTALALAAYAGLSRRAPASCAAGVLAALALFLTGEAVFCGAVSAPYRADCAAAITFAGAAGFGLTGSLLIHAGAPAVRRRWLFAAQVLLLFTTGAVLRYAAVASGESGIDVYHTQQEAADHLRAGENPYTAAYYDEGAPFYPPLQILVAVPLRAAGLDVRLGNVVCDLAAALALLAGAGLRGERLLGALLAAAYLHFPRVPLILQLDWHEPMLAAALGAGMVLASRGWRSGYFVLGLGLTGKQYAVVALPALLKGRRGQRGALLLGTALAAAVVVLPFFLWEPSSFFSRVVEHHLKHEVRLDAITVQAVALNRFAAEVPKWLLYGSALVLTGLVVCRTPSRGPCPGPWMATSLLIFFLVYCQAFVNYFYLCQYLMLLGMTDWFARDAEAG